MSSEKREDDGFTPSNANCHEFIGLAKEEVSEIDPGRHSAGEVIAWLRQEKITPIPLRSKSKAPWYGITRESLKCDTSFLIPTPERLQVVNDYWDSRDWQRATPKDIGISIGVLNGWNNGVYVAFPDIDNRELVDDFRYSEVFSSCPLVKGKKGAKLIAKVVLAEEGEVWPDTPIQWRPISDSSDGPPLELFTGDAKKHCVIYGEHDKSTREHPIFYQFVRGFGDMIPTLALGDVIKEMDKIASLHGLYRVEQSEPTKTEWQALHAQTNSRSGVGICEQYGIQMSNVLVVPPNARRTSSGTLFEHPVHGATGQGNLFVNTRLNLWYCFRCGAGGDPLTWVAVREGFIECNEAGHLDKNTVKKCLDVLRQEGLVPELKAEVVVSSLDHEQFEITFGKHLSDLGNAERFVERFGESVRYCKEMNAWFIWDGHRWVQDKTDKIMQFAVQVPSIIDIEVGLIDRLPGKSEEEKRHMKDAYRQWARTSEYKNRLYAIVDLAKTFEDVAIHAQQWDCDNWLLNVRNGTLNLKAGELRGHNREDYITKYLPIDYDAGAFSERWEAFLIRCVPNEAVRSFLKRAAGYSLTGLTVQEAIFFLYGEPATGKSTFLETLLAIWGDYSISSSFYAFLTQRGNAGGPREDVTRLNGSRMVLCSEVNRNTTWNAALIKSLSSGDKMTARNPYASYSIEFEPIFKLWLGANYRPKCDYDDEAVFRRFNIVPFNVQIPKEERDRGLKDYFKNDEEARKAVLAWAVSGCLERLKRRHLTEDEEKAVRKAFLKKEGNPRILIVTEKLLTGFDAPILYCMYLDKPMRDHVLLQAIARINRPYEDDSGLVKPFGFVMDFVGIFDKLKKALAFDSDVVASVIQNIDVLKQLFTTLMSEQAPLYTVYSSGWDDKSKERAIEAFKGKDKKEEFFKFFRQVQNLYDILSPDAFLRPYIKQYLALSELYALLRNAYANRVYVDREVTAKTKELLRKETGIDFVDFPSEIHELGPKELTAIKKSDAPTTAKILNLKRILGETVSKERVSKPFVLSIGERAAVLEQSYDSRIQTSVDALDEAEKRKQEAFEQETLLQFEKLAEEYIAADTERQRLNIDENTYAIYTVLKLVNKEKVISTAQTINALFQSHTDYQWDGKQEAQLRAELYRIVLPVVGADKMIEITNTLLRLRRV